MSEFHRQIMAFSGYEKKNHVLNGYPIAGPTGSLRRFRCAMQASTAGVNCTLQVGNRIVLNDQNLALKNAEPIEPDDFHFSFLAYPGEVVVFNFREILNGTPNLYFVVKADTLAVRRK